MTIANFLQKARHALVPMRKATIDALLLGTLIVIILITLVYVGTGILFTYTWLIVPIYALVYLIAVVLRLRQAARETTEWRDRKSTRLNSSHQIISYAVFCLKNRTAT